MPGIDPTPFTAWGVLGLLGVVIVVLVLVILKLFTKQTSTMEVRDRLIMDFVNVHRGETTTAMQGVAATVAASYDKMAAAFGRQARSLDEVLLSNRVLDRLEAMKQRGVALTPEEVDRVVRSLIHERSSARD